MWSEQSAQFMGWPRTQDLRESVCYWAARWTNRHRPDFHFDRGMQAYALAYLLDLYQGQALPTLYAQGVVNYWGRRFPYLPGSLKNPSSHGEKESAMDKQFSGVVTRIAHYAGQRGNDHVDVRINETGSVITCYRHQVNETAVQECAEESWRRQGLAAVPHSYILDRAGSKHITFDDLPETAKLGFSQDQRSYIDEFSFLWKDGLIECHYAGELLVVWNGHNWTY